MNKGLLTIIAACLLNAGCASSQRLEERVSATAEFRYEVKGGTLHAIVKSQRVSIFEVAAACSMVQQKYAQIGVPLDVYVREDETKDVAPLDVVLYFTDTLREKVSTKCGSFQPVGYMGLEGNDYRLFATKFPKDFRYPYEIAANQVGFVDVEHVLRQINDADDRRAILAHTITHEIGHAYGLGHVYVNEKVGDENCMDYPRADGFVMGFVSPNWPVAFHPEHERDVRRYVQLVMGNEEYVNVAKRSGLRKKMMRDRYIDPTKAVHLAGQAKQ